MVEIPTRIENYTVLGEAKCKKCALPVGEVVAYKDLPYLFDGKTLCLIGFRWCSRCGTMFYWDGNHNKKFVANHHEKV